jgi:hypothetical protein
VDGVAVDGQSPLLLAVLVGPAQHVAVLDLIDGDPVHPALITAEHQVLPPHLSEETLAVDVAEASPDAAAVAPLGGEEPVLGAAGLDAAVELTGLDRW